MILRSTFVVLFCTQLLYAGTLQANAFGLEMGVATSELATIKDEGSPDGMFRILEIEDPAPLFTAYIGQFSEQQGLCWVKAIGGDIPSDATGTEIKALFQLEKKRLETLYGLYKDFDFRFSGRSDDDLQNWLQAVKEGDRYVASIWNAQYGSELPDTVDSVGLVVNAYSDNTGYLSLEYTFNNIVSCENELSKAE